LAATTEGFTAGAKRDYKIAEDYYKYALGAYGPDDKRTIDARGIVESAQDAIGMFGNEKDKAKYNETMTATGLETYKDVVAGQNADIVTNWAQNGLPYKRDNKTQLTPEEAVNELTTDPTERKKLMSTYSEAVSAFNAGQKVANDRAIEEELAYIDDRFILPDSEFLAQAPDLLKKINESDVLPVKGTNGAGKEGQRKKINDRIKAIKNGETDPLYEYDVDFYNALSARISKNPRDVSETEINNAAGRGKVGGITAGQDGQQGKLIKLKRFLQDDIANNRLFTLYSGAINTLQASKAFHQNKKKNAELAAEARILMNSWDLK
jgi:hypothetical protein